MYSVYVENEKARRSRQTSKLNMIRGAAVIRDRSLKLLFGPDPATF
jgi:hypothetical protein